MGAKRKWLGGKTKTISERPKKFQTVAVWLILLFLCYLHYSKTFLLQTFKLVNPDDAFHASPVTLLTLYSGATKNAVPGIRPRTHGWETTLQQNTINAYVSPHRSDERMKFVIKINILILAASLYDGSGRMPNAMFSESEILNGPFPDKLLVALWELVWKQLSLLDPKSFVGTESELTPFKQNRLTKAKVKPARFTAPFAFLTKRACSNLASKSLQNQFMRENPTCFTYNEKHQKYFFLQFEYINVSRVRICTNVRSSDTIIAKMKHHLAALGYRLLALHTVFKGSFYGVLGTQNRTGKKNNYYEYTAESFSIDGLDPLGSVNIPDEKLIIQGRKKYRMIYYIESRNKFCPSCGIAGPHKCAVTQADLNQIVPGSGVVCAPCSKSLGRRIFFVNAAALDKHCSSFPHTFLQTYEAENLRDGRIDFLQNTLQVLEMTTELPDELFLYDDGELEEGEDEEEEDNEGQQGTDIPPQDTETSRDYDGSAEPQGQSDANASTADLQTDASAAAQAPQDITSTPPSTPAKNGIDEMNIDERGSFFIPNVGDKRFTAPGSSEQDKTRARTTDAADDKQGTTLNFDEVS